MPYSQRGLDSRMVIPDYFQIHLLKSRPVTRLRVCSIKSAQVPCDLVILEHVELPRLHHVEVIRLPYSSHALCVCVESKPHANLISCIPQCLTQESSCQHQAVQGQIASGREERVAHALPHLPRFAGISASSGLLGRGLTVLQILTPRSAKAPCYLGLRMDMKHI